MTAKISTLDVRVRAEASAGYLGSVPLRRPALVLRRYR